MPRFYPAARDGGRPGPRRTLRELREEWTHVVQARYPEFVYRTLPQLAPDEVPVFLVHTVMGAAFEAQLRHLAENDYYTLTADEYVATLRREWRAPRRAVLLTADDVPASVWRQGHQLLQKYGMRMTLFVIAGHTPQLETPRTFLEPTDGPPPPEAPGEYLTAWCELREMQRAGTADVQSHSFRHARRTAGDELLDFFNPYADWVRRRTWHDLVPPATEQLPCTRASIEALAGTPVMESASMFAGWPRFRLDPELERRCQARVANEGGAAFFGDRRWRRYLDQEVDSHLAAGGRLGALDDADALRCEVLDDLTRARQAIEREVPTASVRHFALPYGEGSDEMLPVMREVGLESVFWTVREDRRTNLVGQDPLRSVRVKADLIHCLPGRGQRTLFAVLGERVARRVRGDPVR